MTAPVPAPFVGVRGARVPNGTVRVTVYDVATGEQMEVKPISAREGVERGVWSRTPPVDSPDEQLDPEPPPSAKARRKPKGA